MCKALIPALARVIIYFLITMKLYHSLEYIDISYPSPYIICFEIEIHSKNHVKFNAFKVNKYMYIDFLSFIGR